MKLVVVEDDAAMRTLIRFTLRGDPALQIVGEASSLDDAVERVRTAQPDLVILDHLLDGETTGLQAAPILKRAAPDAKVLLFTTYDLRNEAAREPTIDGFLRKTMVHELLPAVHRLLGRTA